MKPYELDMLRLEELYHRYTGIPAWAKAEQLERRLPQSQIWTMTDQPETSRKGRRHRRRDLPKTGRWRDALRFSIRRRSPKPI